MMLGSHHVGVIIQGQMRFCIFFRATIFKEGVRFYMSLSCLPGAFVVALPGLSLKNGFLLNGVLESFCFSFCVKALSSLLPL